MTPARTFTSGPGTTAIAAAVIVGLLLGEARAVESPRQAIAPFNAREAKAHREKWAAHLATSVEQHNSFGMTMILIPPGEYLMGSSPEQIETALHWLTMVPRVAQGEADRIRNEEQPQHRVLLTRPIRIGRTEVTVGQYRRFVTATNYVTETERFGGGNSSKPDETDPVKRKTLWHSPGYPVTEQSPVTQITWNDMIVFCNWLSEQEGRERCYRQDEQGVWERVADTNGYRLPTEAEWEFACRAGTTTHYSFGDELTALDEYAWFNRTAEQGNQIGARPVASKRPNAFGLYDMHGNAWERCQDFHDPSWYGKSPLEDPQGPPTGGRRMVRGAGWHYFDLHCRSAYRNNYSPIGRTGNTGFRVVCGM